MGGGFNPQLAILSASAKMITAFLRIVDLDILETWKETVIPSQHAAMRGGSLNDQHDD